MSSEGSGHSRAQAAAGSSSRKASMPSIISTGLTVHGDLLCEGDIQIEGLVQGNVRGCNLTIGEAGAVEGAVDADAVQVCGSVTGQIRANSVTLTRTARILGDIYYENLAIEAGARLNGMCKRLRSIHHMSSLGADAPGAQNLLLGGGLSDEQTTK